MTASKFISDADMADLKANPSHISALYAAYSSAFKTNPGVALISGGWSEDRFKKAFCSVVAYHAAPYGSAPPPPSPPRPFTMSELLNAATLNCGVYVQLTEYLADAMGLDTSDMLSVSVIGGAVGNHDQLLLQNAVLLDPTIGLIWNGLTYDELFTGKKFTSQVWASFYYRGDIDAFVSKVSDALYNGKYKPSDHLSDIPGLANFLANPSDGFWSHQRWTVAP